MKYFYHCQHFFPPKVYECSVIIIICDWFRLIIKIQQISIFVPQDDFVFITDTYANYRLCLVNKQRRNQTHVVGGFE